MTGSGKPTATLLWTTNIKTLGVMHTFTECGSVDLICTGGKTCTNENDARNVSQPQGTI